MIDIWGSTTRVIPRALLGAELRWHKAVLENGIMSHSCSMAVL